MEVVTYSLGQWCSKMKFKIIYSFYCFSIVLQSLTEYHSLWSELPVKRLWLLSSSSSSSSSLSLLLLLLLLLNVERPFFLFLWRTVIFVIGLFFFLLGSQGVWYEFSASNNSYKKRARKVCANIWPVLIIFHDAFFLLEEKTWLPTCILSVSIVNCDIHVF